MTFPTSPSAPVQVPQAMPAYLTVANDLRMLPPYVPSDFPATKVRRISDNTIYAANQYGSTSGTPWNNFGPVYPLFQHFNSDNTRVIVQATVTDSNGFGLPIYRASAQHLVNATTGAYIKVCENADGTDGLTPMWRWSNTNTDEIIYKPFSDRQLKKYVPSTGVITQIADFNSFYSSMDILGGGEGSQSLDDRYWALKVQKTSDGLYYLVCYDRQLDSVTCEIPLPAALWNNGYAHGMSASGNYLWIGHSVNDWISGSTTVQGTVALFNRSGVYQRALRAVTTNTNPARYTGCTLDSDGNDVWIHYGSTDNGITASRHVASWRMDGTQGNGTTTGSGRIELAEGKLSDLNYTVACCRNWIVITQYPTPTGNATTNQYPLRGMCFALKIDGSGIIYPIMPERFSLVDYTQGASSTNTIPWATPNRDMTAILYKSGFSLDWSGGGGLPTAFHAILAKQT